MNITVKSTITRQNICDFITNHDKVIITKDNNIIIEEDSFGSSILVHTDLTEDKNYSVEELILTSKSFTWTTYWSKFTYTINFGGLFAEIEYTGAWNGFLEQDLNILPHNIHLIKESMRIDSSLLDKEANYDEYILAKKQFLSLADKLNPSRRVASKLNDLETCFLEVERQELNLSDFIIEPRKNYGGLANVYVKREYLLHSYDIKELCKGASFSSIEQWKVDKFKIEHDSDELIYVGNRSYKDELEVENYDAYIKQLLN